MNRVETLTVQGVIYPESRNGTDTSGGVPWNIKVLQKPEGTF